MKVNELASILKVSANELLDLLSNVGANIEQGVESVVDRDWEKKLAKRYDIPYPFKTNKPAPKQTVKSIEPVSPATLKNVVRPETVVPKQKEQPLSKPQAKPQPVPTKPTQPAKPATPGAKPVQKVEPVNLGKVAGNYPQPKPSQPRPQTQQSYSNPQQSPYPAKQQQKPNTTAPKPADKLVRKDTPQAQPFKGTPAQGIRPQVKNHPDELIVQPKDTSKATKVEPLRTVVIAKTDTVAPRVDEKTLTKYEHYLEEDEYNITRENWSSKKKDHTEDPSDAKSRKKNIKIKDVKKEGRTSNIPVTDSDEFVVYYEPGMTVLDIASSLKVSVTDLVKKLFLTIGVMASATSSLERDAAELIAMEYKYILKDKVITDMTRFDEIDIVDDPTQLVGRPPIVTIMGHVDHGKTTLLDTIRSSHVVQGEAGGITQHIGAYQIEKNGRIITFIDTPGHAAFTEMRARGAQITDIVILVVAADDGVMPQTIEAIQHAQAAEVPIIVAINKMDRPGANPERIKQVMTEYNLLAEEWGGETIFVPVSALNGTGVPHLLEMVLLVADMKELKANPNRLGVGTVIEAKLDKGKGPLATLLVQNGTIKIGDIIVVGNTYGKIRSMTDEKQNTLLSAGPAKPVEITGIDEVPFAGEKFMIIENERKAREIASVRSFNKFESDKGIGRAMTLAEALKSSGDVDVKLLNLIIKCDVQGSIEAIRGLLDKIKIEGTKLNIVAARVGGITDSDVNLAIASNAIIVGFNIRPQASISELAKEKGIEIRLYSVIYKLQEDIEKAVKGMLDPVFGEKITGQAEVRELFKVSAIGTIAGCYVTNGFIPRNAGVRLIRNSIVVYTGKLSSLKRFKDDVKEVKLGYDCGMTIEKFNDIKIGDIFECYIMEEIERE